MKNIKNFDEFLNEGSGRKLTAFVLSIGVVSIKTGKTKYGWSIYDSPAQYVYLADNRLLYATENTFEIGDEVIFRNNDNNRKQGSGTIKDKSVCVQADVMAMLKKHGFDYYPLRPFQKRVGYNRKLSTSFSVKGTK